MIGLGGKIAVLVLTVGCMNALAQNTEIAAGGVPGCGDLKAKFDVKTSAGQAAMKGDASSALVYVIEDDSDYHSIPKPTTRAGLDGKWQGATHGNSYLSFSVTPGVHHLCASWQPSFGDKLSRLSPGQGAGAKTFTAEAGGVYYFVVKDILIMRDDSPNTVRMELQQVDGDEGQLLANGRPVAFSKPK